MRGKTPERAVDALLGRMQSTAACITSQPITASGYRPHDVPYHVGFLPIGRFVRLRVDRRRFSILLSLRYEYSVIRAVDGPDEFVIQTGGYSYRIFDTDEHELLAYHWHPANPGDVNLPHLHLSNRLNAIELGRQREPLRLADMHLVTGHVLFEDVVWLLLREFGLQPLVTDWPRVLDEHARVARAALSADLPPHTAG